MEDAKLLANRFREVLLDGKWIANTNYQQQLSDINWEQATKKIASFNTIAVLTLHINYYVAGVLQVFTGGPLEIRDQFSFDFEEIQSEEEWLQARTTLINNAVQFAAAVEVMSEEQLEQPFVKDDYGTYRRNIEAMIEHGYYHLGQISLLKKMS